MTTQPTLQDNMIRVVVSLLLLLYVSSSFAKTNHPTIKHFQTDIRYEYRYNLLRLALQKTTATDGPLTLEALPYKVTQKRGLAFLMDGGVDVVSLATNIDREKQMLPIRIPILRGLLGYRVFLIHDKSKEKFKQVEVLDNLKDQFVAGFGIHWADYKILKANNIPVETSAIYKNLFDMLMAGRFDYFPRGINEAWNEVKRFGSQYPDIAVEDNIAFFYPYPTYFFVRKNNFKLAGRIERGLKLALEDGSFKKLFMDYHQDMINQAQLSDRLMFTLNNPNLPPGTPKIDSSWWLPQAMKSN